MKKIIGEKNGQIKKMISMRMLILSYTIQQVIANICTKIQNPRCSSSCEIFDEKLYWRERKMNKLKKNDKHEGADFHLHNTTCHTQCLYQISKS